MSGCHTELSQLICPSLQLDTRSPSPSRMRALSTSSLLHKDKQPRQPASAAQPHVMERNMLASKQGQWGWLNEQTPYQTPMVLATAGGLILYSKAVELSAEPLKSVNAPALHWAAPLVERQMLIKAAGDLKSQHVSLAGRRCGKI